MDIEKNLRFISTRVTSAYGWAAGPSLRSKSPSEKGNPSSISANQRRSSLGSGTTNACHAVMFRSNYALAVKESMISFLFMFDIAPLLLIYVGGKVPATSSPSVAAECAWAL